MPSIRCRTCNRFAFDEDGFCAACAGIPTATREAMVFLCRDITINHRLARELKRLGLDLTTVTPETARAVFRTLDID